MIPRGLSAGERHTLAEMERELRKDETLRLTFADVPASNSRDACRSILLWLRLGWVLMIQWVFLLIAGVFLQIAGLVAAALLLSSATTTGVIVLYVLYRWRQDQ